MVPSVAASLAFATSLPINSHVTIVAEQHHSSAIGGRPVYAAEQPSPSVSAIPLVPSSSARVAVIGAGVAGLQSARQLIQAGYQTRVYEATNHIGGVWSYSPHTTSSSPLYKSLHSNIPKQGMTFEGIPYPSDVPSFPSHAQVLCYLEAYSQRHNLASVISFNCPVTSLHKDEDHLWHITSERGDAHSYHAVFICTGHFSKPAPWQVEGLHHLHQMSVPISHSLSYKMPHAYQHKQVLVVGAGPSGVDIALELSTMASHVYLSHSRGSPVLPISPPDNLSEIGRINRVLPNGSLQHSKGIIDAVDMVVTCTGYHHHYPFLHAGDSEVYVFPDGQSVRGLVRHCIALEDPTLCFIGTPDKTIPFPMSEEQVAFAIATLEGRISRDTLQRLWEEDRCVSVDDKYFQTLGERNWEYMMDLAKLTGRPPVPDAMMEVVNHAQASRRSDPTNYRGNEYIMTGPGKGMWSVSDS